MIKRSCSEEKLQLLFLVEECYGVEDRIFGKCITKIDCPNAERAFLFAVMTYQYETWQCYIARYP